MNLTTLVLGGGGSKGISVLGTLDYFYRKNLLEHIERISGTSIGSVIGALLGIGVSPADMFEVVKSVEVPLKGRLDYKKILKKYGVWSLSKSLSPFLSFLINHFGKSPTFEEYFSLTGVHLKVCASNLNKLEATYFDHIDYPDVKVTDALRASCCIPGIFRAVKIKGQYYVDGGFVNNLPYDVWNHIPEEQILAITVSGTPPRQEIIDAMTYVSRIAHLAIISKVRGTIKTKRRSIIVDTFLDDVPLIPTSVTKDQKNQIFKRGQLDAKTHLSKRVVTLD